MTSGWFSMSQVRLEADTWINTYKKENCGRCDAFWTGQSLKWRWTQEFPVCPVVRTQRFCCWGPGSIPDQGTKIPQVIRGGQKKKKNKPAFWLRSCSGAASSSSIKSEWDSDHTRIHILQTSKTVDSSVNQKSCPKTKDWEECPSSGLFLPVLPMAHLCHFS